MVSLAQSPWSCDHSSMSVGSILASTPQSQTLKEAENEAEHEAHQH